MRITIDIDEKILSRIQKITGKKKKSPAVLMAIEMLLREERKKKILDMALSGETDFPLTNEQLEARSSYDPG